MSVTAILALVGTVLSLIVSAVTVGSPVNYEALILKILQAIYSSVPQSVWLAIASVAEKAGDDVLKAFANAKAATPPKGMHWNSEGVPEHDASSSGDVLNQSGMGSGGGDPG